LTNRVCASICRQVAKATAHPTEKSLFLLQKISAGKTSKEYAKGFFSGGARAGLPAQAAGLG